MFSSDLSCFLIFWSLGVDAIGDDDDLSHVYLPNFKQLFPPCTNWPTCMLVLIHKVYTTCSRVQEIGLLEPVFAFDSLNSFTATRQTFHLFLSSYLSLFLYSLVYIVLPVPVLVFIFVKSCLVEQCSVCKPLHVSLLREDSLAISLDSHHQKLSVRNSSKSIWHQEYTLELKLWELPVSFCL